MGKEVREGTMRPMMPMAHRVMEVGQASLTTMTVSITSKMSYAQLIPCYVDRQLEEQKTTGIIHNPIANVTDGLASIRVASSSDGMQSGDDDVEHGSAFDSDNEMIGASGEDACAVIESMSSNTYQGALLEQQSRRQTEKLGHVSSDSLDAFIRGPYHGRHGHAQARYKTKAAVTDIDDLFGDNEVNALEVAARSDDPATGFDTESSDDHSYISGDTPSIGQHSSQVQDAPGPSKRSAPSPQKGLNRRPPKRFHPNPTPHVGGSSSSYDSDTAADIVIPRRMPGSAVFGLNDARKGSNHNKLIMGARRRG